jgi:hypothetical protein
MILSKRNKEVTTPRIRAANEVMATGFCQAKTKNSKLRLAGFDNK